MQIKYVLPKLRHLPQYSYGSRDPNTGYEPSTRFRAPAPVLYWGSWHSIATHT